MQTILSPYRLLPITTFFGGSFLLHLLWENLQAPLYVGFTSFRQHFWICFKATWGDLLFMLLMYAVLAIVHQDPLWLTKKSTYAHPATWIMTLLLGVLLAVNVELWAVYVAGRRQYEDAMPLVPILHVGLTPILQMLIIPLAILLFTSRFSRSA